MGNFKYSLELISGYGKGTVFSIDKTATIIGSGQSADIVVQGSNIADNHCLLKKVDGYLTVIDMHTGTGTEVGGRKILSETVLNSGDVITVGDVKLRVLASTFKERLFSVLPAKKEDNNRKYGDFLGNSKIKAGYAKLVLPALLVMAFLGGIFLVYPLYISFNSQLKAMSVDRGVALVKTLALVNADVLKQGKHNLLDTSIVAKENGVQMAVILADDGSVLAPADMRGKKVADAFGKKAVKTEKLLVQRRAGGMVDISLPIKYYDLEKGDYVNSGAIARIIVTEKPSSLEKGLNWKVLLLIGFVAYLILACLMASLIKNAVKKDIYLFIDDCEEHIRFEGKGLLEEKYSPEFNKLVVTINRMLRKKT